MPRFRAEVVLYFDAEGMRAVPRRIHEFTAAAAAVGFELQMRPRRGRIGA